MRFVTYHLIEGKGQREHIIPTEPKHAGQAPTTYRITVGEDWRAQHTLLEFQRVASGEKGITNESLIAVMMDRLEHYQAGPYACEENAKTLEHLKGAMEALHARTLRRLAEGTEGTYALTPGEKVDAPILPDAPVPVAAAPAAAPAEVPLVPVKFPEKSDDQGDAAAQAETGEKVAEPESVNADPGAEAAKQEEPVKAPAAAPATPPVTPPRGRRTTP